MIFLDANIFLRFLTAPTDDKSRHMTEQARSLIKSIQSGDIEATCTELVLHEVFYVLTSSRQYGLPAANAIAVMRPLIRLRSLRFGPGEKAIILRALDIWEQLPHLEFADSVIAARCEANGWELATFDEQLGSLPSVTRWTPSATA